MQKAYPVGRKVTVYYYPESPQTAVLIPGNGYGKRAAQYAAAGDILVLSGLLITLVHCGLRWRSELNKDEPSAASR